MTTPDKEEMPTEDSAAVLLATAIAYLREEADFNRSWADGRRKVDFGPGSDSEGYKAHRLELAAVREAWADAIEHTCNAYEPMREALTAGLSQLKACREQLELYEQDASGETYNSPSLNTAIKVIDAALSTLPVNDRHHSGSDNERLREALAALVGDVLDYERRNEIYPNPGRQFCWQSTENAVAVLISLGVWQLPVSGDVAVRDALKGTDRQTSDDAGRLREALSEALPLVEQAEFLESRAFSYGGGGSEPSPSEWGISVGYQQTREAMPHAQFLAEVADFHCENREEDDGDGKFLTVANKIRAALKGVPQPASDKSGEGK